MIMKYITEHKGVLYIKICLYIPAVDMSGVSPLHLTVTFYQFSLLIGVQILYFPLIWWLFLHRNTNIIDDNFLPQSRCEQERYATYVAHLLRLANAVSGFTVTAVKQQRLFFSSSTVLPSINTATNVKKYDKQSI